ncbi:phage antirepressor KilAC domain protein [Carnobacterium maltaromaticum LMA28]|uniref:Phage antirepressor KilAC domain protein n=1 Tax=Carnobacterium maltaromaticum LMA28 TaxID=1234679 RepID=K8E5P4_CARML|nr:phage antirepressor KilAC domain-containing protein [Carnobacterium maltaromaticum]CCO12097.2 phage antirepressor KilAC domain protein [Carnobacterium maltaromaticum LMA28]
MSNLQKFNFEQNEVQTVLINEELYFIGKEISTILGYSNSRKALSDHVDPEDKLVLTSQIVTLENIPNRGLIGINESGLYSLVIGSKLPTAKKFKRWVTKEVLPSIRKNGMYATDELLDNPDLLIEVATKLKEERTLRLVAEQRVAEYEPKISYLDSILESTDTVTITQIAADYGLSAVAMNKRLNELKIQHKVGGQWILYTRHQREGYTKSHTTRVPKADGTEKVVMNTKWTQKGRLFIYESLKEINVYPLMDIEQLQLA